MVNYNSTSTSGPKSKKNVIIIILVAALLVAAAAYFATAYFKKDLWPFSQTVVESPSAAVETPAISTKPDSIIKAASVTNKDGMKTLTVKVQTTKREKGTCTLTLSSQSLSLTMKGASKGKKDMIGCSGWTADVSKLPKGTYTAKVVFTGETTKESGSTTVTIK